MPSKTIEIKNKVRYAANSLDYKKIITQRSFDKDWKPKYPLFIHNSGCEMLPRLEIVNFQE